MARGVDYWRHEIHVLVQREGKYDEEDYVFPLCDSISFLWV